MQSKKSSRLVVRQDSSQDSRKVGMARRPERIVTELVARWNVSG